jgi:hypothetical protein
MTAPLRDGATAVAPLRRNTAWTVLALLASSGTLICCVLPAAMVAVGAGAVLASWVGAVPQLVLISEHKTFVFAFAALALLGAGASMWRARRLPCPAEPALARACQRMRRVSAALFVLALAAFCAGVAFAYVLPAL